MSKTVNKKKIMNIDVTLRDGGYQNNFTFPSQYILKHIENIANAGVEYCAKSTISNYCTSFQYQ